MYDCSLHHPSRPPSRGAGPFAGAGALLAGILGLLVACGSDDSAPQTGTGGTGAEEPAPAAAGRGNRGEGYELTPSFDITNPQRPVPPREQLVEGASSVYGTGGSRGSAAPDAGSADAGADAAP